MLSKTNTLRNHVQTVEGKWGYTVFRAFGVEYSIGTAEFELQQILDTMHYPQKLKEKLVDAIENYVSECSINEARNNDTSGDI